MLQHYFSWFLKNISYRGSHRKQITHRSYTQPIPSIRINGASPPLNGTRQNTTEPTGQLNGDISRNKYQAYSPTGKPSLPLPLLLCQKDYLACRIRFLVLYGVIVFTLKIQESSFQYEKYSTNVHNKEANLWQGSGSSLVDEFGCLFYKEMENNLVRGRPLSFLLLFKNLMLGKRMILFPYFGPIQCNK